MTSPLINCSGRRDFDDVIMTSGDREANMQTTSGSGQGPLVKSSHHSGESTRQSNQSKALASSTNDVISAMSSSSSASATSAIVSSRNTPLPVASTSTNDCPSTTPSSTQKMLCIDKKKSESSPVIGIGSLIQRLTKVSLSSPKESAYRGDKNSRSTSLRFLKFSKQEEASSWRDLGDVETLRRTKCRRLYAKAGQAKDLALFYKKGNFFAMDAWCSHMGGPLYEGDIEDYNGSLHVLCPWHAYMFDVTTGCSDIGLQQDVFAVKTEHGRVYVNYTSDLSLYPYL